MKALLPFFITISLYATDISDLINKAFLNNPEIKKLEYSIESKNYDILNSTKYKNPILTIGVNDIYLDDPSIRDLEPMQTNYVTISQEIISNDKLQLKEKIEVYNRSKIELLLKEKKDKLVKQIYTIYYNINTLEKSIKLNNQKIENIKKIQNYHNNHLQNTKAFQQSIRNDLAIEKLNLDILIKQQKIKELYIKLEEIINDKVTTIFNNKAIAYKKDINAISNHTLLKLQELSINQNRSKSDLAKENQSSNYTLSMGYFHRESRDDYMNLAIKFPLNIYKKEKNIYARSKKQILESQSEYENIKNILKQKFETNIIKLQTSTKSIGFTNKIIASIEKEMDLISRQNNPSSISMILELENKIIDNKLMLLEYKKKEELYRLELSYLSSSLR